jgi:hypothetical protein
VSHCPWVTESAQGEQLIGDFRLDRGDEGFVLILLLGLSAQWRESLKGLLRNRPTPGGDTSTLA